MQSRSSAAAPALTSRSTCPVCSRCSHSLSRTICSLLMRAGTGLYSHTPHSTGRCPEWMHPQGLARHPMLACGATCSQSDVVFWAVQALVGLMGEEDAETLKACWEALGKVSASVPKEVQPSHVRCVKEAVGTAREKERRKRRSGPQLLPGFCLPKALAPVLPFYLQGVLQVHRSWARGFLCTETYNKKRVFAQGFVMNCSV